MDQNSEEFVGYSEQIKVLKSLIARAARSNATVLVTGETGTGKELVARNLHSLSERNKNAFVSINCAAIPDTLLESELFGFEKGAFTGATYRREGLLAQADKGTLFLDEIGDLSPLLQAKILRALEERTVRRIGSSRNEPLNVRFVAATNRDLGRMHSAESFRADLLYRLSVIHLHIPPLRERPADILPIATALIGRLARQYNRPVPELTAGAVAYLHQQPWLGNVRELRNAIERAFVLVDSEKITEADLVDNAAMALSRIPMEALPEMRMQSSRLLPLKPARLSRADAKGELSRLTEALEITHWNKTKAAQLLFWSRMKIYRKIVQYDLKQPVAPEHVEAIVPQA
ncbi:MAG TPA: sigma-54 dependent transcriptional regulator [Bryobacteraceae bacterium]